MRTVTTIILLCLISHIIKAQQNFNLPESRLYKNAKISLQDYTKYEASNLSILSDSLEFINKLTLAKQKVSLIDVNYLRVQIGNKVPEWALYGGLFGGIMSLYLVVDASYYYYNSSNMGSICAVMIIGGVVLGGLIGLTIPKWKTYYVNNPTSFINSIKPELYAGKNNLGLKLTFTLNN